MDSATKARRTTDEGRQRTEDRRQKTEGIWARKRTRGMKSNRKRGLAIIGIAGVVPACFLWYRESVDETLLQGDSRRILLPCRPSAEDNGSDM